MTFYCIGCRYKPLLGLKGTEKQVMLGPYILGLTLPVGSLLHPELEKPTHCLISVLRGSGKSLHITREWLVVIWDPPPTPIPPHLDWNSTCSTSLCLCPFLFPLVLSFLCPPFQLWNRHLFSLCGSDCRVLRLLASLASPWAHTHKWPLIAWEDSCPRGRLLTYR